ncbi:MAG: hypothetical protein ACJ8D6_06745 [Sphingomicrobium sp.]
MKKSAFDLLILGCTIVLLALVVSAILWNVSTQVSNYQEALRQEMASQAPSKVFLLSANRALDFVLIRSAALLFGVVLTLLGGLYLFRLFDAPIELNAGRSQEGSISLRTSSPGMLMISLGVILIIATVYARSSVNYRYETGNGVARESASSIRDDPSATNPTGSMTNRVDQRVIPEGSQTKKVREDP